MAHARRRAPRAAGGSTAPSSGSPAAIAPGVFVVWAMTDPTAGAQGHHARSSSRGGTRGLSARQARGQDGPARLVDRAAACSTASSCRDDALLGQARRRASARDDRARRRAHRHRLAGARHRRGALEAARAYVKRARAVRPADRQASRRSQFMLADAATWLDAARLMTLRAAWLKEQRPAVLARGVDGEAVRDRAAWRVCDTALQVHGGYGYMRDFPGRARRCATCASRGSTKARARSSAS